MNANSHAITRMSRMSLKYTTMLESSPVSTSATVTVLSTSSAWIQRPSDWMSP